MAPPDGLVKAVTTVVFSLAQADGAVRLTSHSLTALSTVVALYTSRPGFIIAFSLCFNSVFFYR